LIVNIIEFEFEFEILIKIWPSVSLQLPRLLSTSSPWEQMWQQNMNRRKVDNFFTFLLSLSTLELVISSQELSLTTLPQ